MSSGHTASVSGWWDRHYVARFPLRFLLYTLLAIRLSTMLDSAWPSLTHATARMVAWLCALTGLSAAPAPARTIFGISLDSPESRTLVFGDGAFSYQIIGECTAVLLFGVFAAAVFAYPATWRQRTLGLLAGAPVVLALNLLRLVTLAWLGVHWPDAFDQVHILGWQTFNILVVGVGWFAWVRLVVDAEHRNEAGSASRLRETLGTMIVFVAVVVVLSLAGVLASGVQAYEWLLGGAIRPLMRAVVGERGAFVGVRVLENVIWLYATAAAVIALYIATPRVSMRKRGRAALLTGLPVVFGFQVIATVAGTWLGFAMRVHAAGAEQIVRVLLVANITVPLATWYWWNRRARRGRLVQMGVDD